MKVIGHFDDSYEDLRRIVYTIELEPNTVVDVLVSDDLAYVMQNGDGSTVYNASEGNDCTCPDYEYDEGMVLDIAVFEFQKEYGGWE